MSKVFFERLHPANITPDMVALLEESKQWDESETETNEILSLIADGHAQFWYFNNGTQHGIMITQILKEAGEHYVFIWRFFGAGFLPVYDYVEEKLMDFARSQGALTIQTETHDKGSKILQAHGFHKNAEVLVKEVHYG